MLGPGQLGRALGTPRVPRSSSPVKPGLKQGARPNLGFRPRPRLRGLTACAIASDEELLGTFRLCGSGEQPLLTPTPVMTMWGQMTVISGPTDRKSVCR